jgi:hypothetical protein
LTHPVIDRDQPFQVDTLVHPIQSVAQGGVVLHPHRPQHVLKIGSSAGGTQVRVQPASQILLQPHPIGLRPNRILLHAIGQPTETQQPLPKISHFKRSALGVVLTANGQLHHVALHAHQSPAG